MKTRHDYFGKPISPGRWFRDGTTDVCLARVRKADEEDVEELKLCMDHELERMGRKTQRRPRLVAAIKAKLEALEYAEL